MELEANGGTLFYDALGSGPALLMPSHASAPRFRACAEHFADEYTVIGLDLRDAGGATRFPPMPYGVDDLADDCLAVLQAVGFERCHYLGLSHSGVLGQAFALRHPDRLDRLALTMTTPGRDRPVADAQVDAIDDGALSTTAELAALLQRAQAGDAEALREIAGMALSERAARDRPEMVDASVRDVFGPSFGQPADARARFWSALARFSARGRLADIEAPTLVMTGRGDRMVAIDDSWTLWREIPRATLVALDVVGHDWEIEAPELGASIVKSFLRGAFDSPG